MQANAHHPAHTRDTNISCIAQFAIRSPGRLKRFLRHWEKNEDDIDDIISTALLNALRCAHTYTGESSIETWFYGVCKNTARQHVAAKVHSRQYIHNTEDLEDFDQCTEDHGTPSLEEEIDKKQRLQKLADCISTLPPDQQTIFQAVYIEGVSYEDFAKEQNIPLGTLKSRINRLRSDLLRKNSPCR